MLPNPKAKLTSQCSACRNPFVPISRLRQTPPDGTRQEICNTRKTADGLLRSGGRSAQLTSRYITFLWDPPIISSFLLLTLTRDELRSCSRAAVAPFRRSPSSGHHTSIPYASIVPSTSSTFPNPQPGFSRPESPQPPPITIGARLKLAPSLIHFCCHPPLEPTAGMDSC